MRINMTSNYALIKQSDTTLYYKFNEKYCIILLFHSLIIIYIHGVWYTYLPECFLGFEFGGENAYIACVCYRQNLNLDRGIARRRCTG